MVKFLLVQTQHPMMRYKCELDTKVRVKGKCELATKVRVADVTCGLPLLKQLNEKSGIVNIPESAEVKIMRKWNGIRPSIKPLLPEFYICMANSKLKQIHRNRTSRKYSVRYENHKTGWIETLLQIPISDHRREPNLRQLHLFIITIKQSPMIFPYTDLMRVDQEKVVFGIPHV